MPAPSPNSIVSYPVGMTFFTTPDRLEIGGHPLVVRRPEGHPRGGPQVLPRRGAGGGAAGSDVRPPEGGGAAGRPDGTAARGILATGRARSGHLRPAGAGDRLLRSPQLARRPGGRPAPCLPLRRRAACRLGPGGGHHRRQELGGGGRAPVLPRRGPGHPGLPAARIPGLGEVLAPARTSRTGSAPGRSGSCSAPRRRRSPPLECGCGGRTGGSEEVPADRVYALTGYHPDFSLFDRIGIASDPVSGKPALNPETLETNVPGVFLAGSAGAGRAIGEVFIENGRMDGEKIFGTAAERHRAVSPAGVPPRPEGE